MAHISAALAAAAAGESAGADLTATVDAAAESLAQAGGSPLDQVAVEATIEGRDIEEIAQTIADKAIAKELDVHVAVEEIKMIVKAEEGTLAEVAAANAEVAEDTEPILPLTGRPG